MKLKKSDWSWCDDRSFHAFAAYTEAGPARLDVPKGDMLFTPEFAAHLHARPAWEAISNMFLKRNISVGGDLVGTLNSPTVMIFSPDVAYHFDVKVKNLDVFAGAGPALAFAVRGQRRFADRLQAVRRRAL